MFTEDRLIGFFILGPKENKEMFHTEDIKVLTKQVEVVQNHLSHTIFMEERASFSRKLAHDMKNLFGKAIEPTIQDILEAKDEKQRQEILNALVSQLKFLKGSLRDNFDLISILERLVKRTYTLVPEDLHKVVSNCISLYKVPFSEKGISLELDIPDNLSKILVNQEDICKVFNNLLDNSLKFTQKGRVLIRAEQKENGALISFSDTGLGIDEEDLESIFEPKAKAPDEESVGTGLGLTIVKDIVEAHKGKIWVESKIGKGTTFYFTLPLAKE
jgi:signal transduction histidine kinase